jgi:hypothetical protein
MRIILSSIIKKISEDLNKLSLESLTEEDVKKLNENSPELIKKVKDHVDNNAKDPLKGLSYEDKILLLSFVVYKRENIATTPIEDPNIEDTAKILHGKVYKLTGDKKEDKEIEKNLEKDLIKQLSKAGLNVK